jgi:hypothetical protein
MNCTVLSQSLQLARNDLPQEQEVMDRDNFRGYTKITHLREQ